MPSRVTWRRKSPNARFMPSWRAWKAGLSAGRCGTNLIDPKRIDSMGVDELQFAELGTGEIAIPARFFPTDGANCRGSTTADPLYDILGFRDEGDGLRAGNLDG